MPPTRTQATRCEGKYFKIYEDPNNTSTPSLSSERPSQWLRHASSPGSGRRVQKRAKSSQAYSPDRFIPSSRSIQSFHMSTPSPFSKKSRSKRISSPDLSQPVPHSNPISPLSPNASFGTTISGNGSRRTAGGGLNASMGNLGITGWPGPARASSSPTQVVETKMYGEAEAQEEEMEGHENRLALALGVDRAARVFNFCIPKSISDQGKGKGNPFLGAGAATAQTWGFREGNITLANTSPLNAPGLRDDFYCTLIAYSPTSSLLAVGLSTEVYVWNERIGAISFPSLNTVHITSLAFSSTQGGQEILAIGRANGVLSLWSIGEPCPRAEAKHSSSVACISWKPVVTNRYGLPGSRRRHSRVEELIVGDEAGNIFYYAIEWENAQSGKSPPEALIVLLRRISVYSQQICGIAWSVDGGQVATGGNDNLCVLFDLQPEDNPGRPLVIDVGDSNTEMILRYKWPHAAVKAIAFCPWQKSLIATGGGSNDRCIHFHHTYSGATLSTINVCAQVTSLQWSTTRKEIVATFGYAKPGHPIRIAVFSWPECRKVASIPWAEDIRVLCAIAYPGGPSEKNREPHEVDEDEMLDISKARSTEGCIVVAASDETIRFYEIWGEPCKGIINQRGILGGSDILEVLNGIEKDSFDVIR